MRHVGRGEEMNRGRGVQEQPYNKDTCQTGEKKNKHGKHNAGRRKKR